MIYTHADNETAAADAFTQQSPLFDRLYGNDGLIRYKRARVRAHVEQLINPGSHILELNCGTGEDAVYFAAAGHRVHATDASGGMLLRLQEKIDGRWKQRISFEECSFTRLEKLQHKGPYDLIFSNFAGLNCTGRLDTVLASFPKLLAPGGTVVLVVLPSFCLWESLLLFSGKFGTAFRRFFANKGRRAKVEGKPFTCWYYDPAYIKEKMSQDFEWLGTEGLCTIVPPSYIRHFTERHPVLFRWLAGLENRYSRSYPWRNIGDYYIISFRKKLPAES